MLSLMLFCFPMGTIGVSVRLFMGLKRDVNSAACSSDNNQIVSGIRAKTIKLWKNLDDIEGRNAHGLGEQGGVLTVCQDAIDRFLGLGQTDQDLELQRFQSKTNLLGLRVWR